MDSGTVVSGGVRICILAILLQLVSGISMGAAAKARPEGVVRSLYRQVVLRHPIGIPRGAAKAAIWPFLSTALKRRLEVGLACESDYDRQHGADDGKPEFGWLETGFFSGENEEAVPAAAVVEGEKPENDGSVRVDVRLTYKESFATYGRPPNPADTFSWQVAALVKREFGRFVVNDVLFFKENSREVDWRLSEIFVGCRGALWVGNQ